MKKMSILISIVLFFNVTLFSQVDIERHNDTVDESLYHIPVDYDFLKENNAQLTLNQKINLYEYHFDSKQEMNRIAILNIVPSLGSWIYGNYRDALIILELFAISACNYALGYYAETRNMNNYEYFYYSSYVMFGMSYIANILLPYYFGHQRNLKLKTVLDLPESFELENTANLVSINLVYLKF